MAMKIQVTPCSDVEGYHRAEEPCYLHLYPITQCLNPEDHDWTHILKRRHNATQIIILRTD